MLPSATPTGIFINIAESFIMCWFYHLDAFASLFAGRRVVGDGGGSQASSSLSVKETPDVSVREKKKKNEKAKQPDPVTARRPGERSVSSVNRSSTTERPHKSPQLLTSPSMGKQYCDNGATAAGCLAELSIWSSGNGSIRLQMCAQFFLP